MEKGRRVVVRYSNTYEKALPNRSLSLSDAGWDYIEPHMPTAKEHGRPRIHSPREVLNAAFYILRSGCRWRLLPVAPTAGGAYFLATSLDGPPSTTTSELGA